MKFDARTFVKQAEPAFSVAKESPLVPIFEYVLIAPIGTGQVSITGSNYGHSVRVVVDCIAQPLKSFCILAPMLWPILKTFDGEVEIICKDKSASVKHGGVDLKVPFLPAKEFPAVDVSGGQLAMTVDLEPYLKTISDMSFFLEPDDGMKPGTQNVLVGKKGLYAFSFVGGAGAVCGKYASELEFILSPGVRQIMSKFTGSWELVVGPGWTMFKQGDFFYKRNIAEYNAEVAIDTCHPVIAKMANTPPLASFEVARIAPAVARAVLIGAASVLIKGHGSKITVSCQNAQAGALLEEEIPADGAVFETRMAAKLLHGVLDIAGYGGVIQVCPPTDEARNHWPPSLLVKNSDKKIMAIIGPITTSV